MDIETKLCRHCETEIESHRAYCSLVCEAEDMNDRRHLETSPCSSCKREVSELYTFTGEEGLCKDCATEIIHEDPEIAGKMKMYWVG